MQSVPIPEDAQMAILIVLTVDNQVSVGGTIDNKVQALGLLETAKYAIVAHVDRLAAGKAIVAPSPGMMHLLDGNGNGRR